MSTRKDAPSTVSGPVHITGTDDEGRVVEFVVSQPHKIWMEVRETGWAILFAVVIAVVVSGFLARHQVAAAEKNGNLAYTKLLNQQVTACEHSNTTLKERNSGLDAVRNYLFLQQSASAAFAGTVDSSTPDGTKEKATWGQLANVAGALAGTVKNLSPMDCTKIALQGK